MTPARNLPGLPAGRLRVVHLAPHPRPACKFVELSGDGDVFVGTDDAGAEPWACTARGLRWAIPADLRGAALDRLLEAAMPRLEALHARLDAFLADRLDAVDEAAFGEAVEEVGRLCRAGTGPRPASPPLLLEPAFTPLLLGPPDGGPADPVDAVDCVFDPVGILIAARRRQATWSPAERAAAMAAGAWVYEYEVYGMTQQPVCAPAHALLKSAVADPARAARVMAALTPFKAAGAYAMATRWAEEEDDAAARAALQALVMPGSRAREVGVAPLPTLAGKGFQ